MRFGIFYEHQLPRPWGPDDEHRLLKDALEQVELADRVGIDFVWEVEHHFLEEYSHSSAPEVFLAAASQRTSRIRLGHGIVQLPLAFNHTARVAERIATLDLISDGRVEFGTGEASSEAELGGFGIDRATKRDQWDEALDRRAGETAEETAARVDAVIASRVPDVRFLLDRILAASWGELELDHARIGFVGHSFGGWTALAATEAEAQIRAVVALAPGGASRPRPGILPVTLTFAWGRDVPTLYLVAEGDTMLPLQGMHELFERTPATKRMIVLRRADHAHFMDQVEQVHEAFRTMPDAGVLEAIQQEMLPMAELCSEEQAHLFARGLTLCHLDAFLGGREEAHALLNGDIKAELARRGVEAWSRA